jgi:mRNA-degrading endonuclease YafQ of YafQ-DinJ toxin-antitoxin module
MTNYTTVPTKGFEKELRKLSAVDQSLVLRKMLMLSDNPFYPSLRTKKLQGKTEVYESSVNMDIRLIWNFDEDEEGKQKIIIMLDVGHHDILNKY